MFSWSLEFGLWSFRLVFGAWCLVLSSPSPSLPGLEETLERLGERLRGAETQRIDAGAAQSAVKIGEAFGICRGKFFADNGAVGIDLEEFSRLSIFDREQTGGRQQALAGVMQMEANQVMPGVRQTDFLDRIPASAHLGGGGAETVQEVGEQKDDRAPMQDMVEKGERGGDVGGAALRLESEQLANEPQDVAPAFARGQKQFDLVGEQQQRDLIAAARGRKGQRACDFSGKFTLRAPQRTESG